MGDYMNIGERIKLKRLNRNQTLEDLGKAAGVSRATIQRYESGVITNIPSDKIEAIAKALRCSPAYLMGWEEDEDPIIVEFTSAEEAVKFLLQQNVIYNYTGLDIEKLTDSELL